MKEVLIAKAKAALVWIARKLSRLLALAAAGLESVADGLAAK